MQENNTYPISSEAIISEDTSNLPDEYQKRFRELAERLLSAKNQYLESKKETDALKGQQDDAEQALLTYVETTGCSAISFDGLGHFSRSEDFYGNVTKPNIDKVKKFFEAQKRDDEFFQTTARKSELNKYVRQKIAEFRHSRFNSDHKGGDINPDLPDGLDMYKKVSISIRGRNPHYGLNQIKGDNV